jgi:hypothetical protein
MLSIYYSSLDGKNAFYQINRCLHAVQAFTKLSKPASLFENMHSIARQAVHIFIKLAVDHERLFTLVFQLLFFPALF